MGEEDLGALPEGAVVLGELVPNGGSPTSGLTGAATLTGSGLIVGSSEEDPGEVYGLYLAPGVEQIAVTLTLGNDVPADALAAVEIFTLDGALVGGQSVAIFDQGTFDGFNGAPDQQTVTAILDYSEAQASAGGQPLAISIELIGGVSAARDGASVLADLAYTVSFAIAGVTDVAPDEPFQGGDGSDTRVGGDGVSSLFGGGGDDSLNGAGGDDTVLGQEGSDFLLGGGGEDLVGGGAGNDYLRGEGGDDGLDAGDGNDVLEGGDGNDRLVADDGADALYGGDSNDLLGGGAGDDLLSGGFGDDILDASDYGNDVVDGGFGDDQLAAGLGNDGLTGGDGRDIFFFRVGGPGVDRVTDFQAEIDFLRNDTGVATETLIANAVVIDEGLVLKLGEDDFVILAGVTEIRADYFI